MYNYSQFIYIVSGKYENMHDLLTGRIGDILNISHDSNVVGNDFSVVSSITTC